MTANEENLLRLLADGLTNKQIAIMTGKSQPTVRATLRKLYDQMDAVNRANAVKIWMESRCG